MRWIVISLIVINIAIFGWHLARPEPEKPAVSAPVQQNTAGVPTIQLLSEADAGQLRQAPSPSPTEAPSTPVSAGSPSAPVGSARLCTMIGPFDRLLTAEYFQERLAALDVPAQVNEIEIPGEVGYWVYLAPQETRKQATVKLNELRARGIDSFIIPNGELANGISLGMFNQKNLAEQRQSDMESQGYGAELKEIPRAYKEVWVLLQPGVAATVNEQTWLELLSDQEGIERRQNYCPPVASE